MGIYHYQDVVNAVKGLNSISTLKRWIILIEQLSPHQFKREIRLVGKTKKIYSPSFPTFTDKEIELIQLVAKNKIKHGLNKAIILTFGDKSPPISMENLVETNQILKRKINNLENQLSILNQKVAELEKHLKETQSKNWKQIFSKK